ncbi:endonuclease III domain-containing protein [Jannaschia seohaensis]|uniref:Endonuclease-3 n=1 Tax=Jannaschia seohaensis TaxID=475081 RepID=A0A2Y9B455_9RHOB|nr:endonuclease III [Jannaschia seohaensis]PWJ12088.1 endonuclease-3 [Jannaschia seohaensis]SSA51191.1 endonuclease-3 [Jannaschia seohaensis]
MGYLSTMLSQDEMTEVFTRLRAARPEIQPPEAKGGRTAFRSVVSCMLSAQSLDRNTAAASRALFALAQTPEGILALSDDQITTAIRPAGLYNVKARNLRKMCRALLDDHGGAVPRDRRGLMSLPGVGRKCADIVLHFTFGQPVVAVDTHVHRVCNRVGLAEGKTEAQTAASLDARMPDAFRMEAHLLLLDHGKRVCRARVPRCGDCLLADLCQVAPMA